VHTTARDVQERSKRTPQTSIQLLLMLLQSTGAQQKLLLLLLLPGPCSLHDTFATLCVCQPQPPLLLPAQ
jgi:hypothetical protein